MSRVVADGDQPPTAVLRRLAPGLSAEAQLLMLMATGETDGGSFQSAARCAIDWDRFLRIARHEGAVSVIHPRLRSFGADLVPGDVLEQMRRMALVSEFALLHLEARLRESLAALARARLRVMLLKGAALAHSVYAGVRERPMSDIDLLVDSSDAEAARRVLRQTGWQEIAGGVPERVYEQHHHLPPLQDSQAPDLQLEIHTALFPQPQPFALEPRDLWARARLLDSAVGEGFVPDAVHSLLYACLHFFWSHQATFGAWRTVRDIDAIARSTELDWDELVSVARNARGDTSCYWTLRIAQTASGLDVPVHVLAALRPPRSAYVLRAVEHHFLINLLADRSPCPSTTLNRALWELGVMPDRSGHGDIRPWDRDSEFMTSREALPPRVDSTRVRRVKSLLASPAYVRRLLLTPH